MGDKFHIALFCSKAAYEARKLFYTEVFGAEPQEGWLNEGKAKRQFWGSCWDRHGLLFALLLDENLSKAEEKLAHIGFFFDKSEDFDAAIKKRGIDPQSVKPDEHGNKQEFLEDGDGVEWEFTLPVKMK